MNEKKVTSKERVFNYLIENESVNFTSKKIVQELGIKEGTVSGRLGILCAAGILRRGGSGQKGYFLNERFTYEEIDNAYKKECNKYAEEHRNKKYGKKKRINKFKKEETEQVKLSPIELGEKLFLYIESLRNKVKRCEEMEVDNKFLLTESFKLQERIRELTEQINGFNRLKKLF